ncbi:Metal-binding trascriptional regulator, contains putative Fe-S cluster and ArsR family DNA binding domain [Desulfacinum hydrothermale DSM 13146]|uniref:Metal-binding trascriptional regulator, contains putative Fe-S cluster and ArsR family DNA binding domain n=1 Tax=Desulfacinum hydrothermale DSM 13146 TaxID=1121390 RepID=A0A1W1X449_9BACT|nr:(Fe-S)-binding protein [Desulfacinum hydrothermale]SMC18724.1 Metal-binding trascriptional regulator, contains putative Fe-S cluster and ArsR family DNA binding domain [Desulfacinum hydrothermale DSM 13146]
MSETCLGGIHEREDYTFQLVNIECMPQSDHYNVVMGLHQSIDELLPYLAAVLPACSYAHGTGVINLMDEGHIVAIYGDRITITDVTGLEDAESWCERYMARIRDVKRRKDAIQPVERRQVSLTVMDIYRRLPKTNCGACGDLTCMAFAARVFRRQVPFGACPEVPREAPETLAFMEELAAQGFPAEA